jgi:GT2 family glycosyltransferase
VYPEHLRTTLSTFEVNLDLAAIGSLHVSQSGENPTSAWNIVDDRRRRYPLALCPAQSESGEATLVDAISLSGMIIRKAAFWCAGGFDERYGSLADLELCLKLRMMGWKLALAPALRLSFDANLADRQRDPSQNISAWQAIHRRYVGLFLPHNQVDPNGTTRIHPWRFSCSQACSPAFARPEANLEAIPAVTPSIAPVSVIVIAQHTADALKISVSSAISSLGIEDEVILVANEVTSKDVGEFAPGDPRVKVVSVEENVGWSEACNAGIRAARGEYVSILSPGVQVFEGWIARTMAHFESADVGAVSPVSNGVAGLQRMEWHAPMGQTGNLDACDFDRILANHNQRRNVEAKLLSGFCTTFRKTALEELGLFDSKCSFGVEDLDICWRLRLAGRRLLVATDVFAFRFAVDAAHPNRESMDHLADKLVAQYGKGNVPTPNLLWGIDWFSPTAA